MPVWDDCGLMSGLAMAALRDAEPEMEAALLD